MRALFLAALVLLLPLPAYADCVRDCQASVYCGEGYWECRDRMNTCYNSCGSSSEKQSYPYGAIAYGEESGAWGLSDASATEAKAEKSALRFCGQNGKDCKIVKTFSNTCAAIAEDADGNVGWATADVKKKAGEAAVENCNDKSDKENCKVSLTNCYSE